MKSLTHHHTLHLFFKIKCCVDRLRPPQRAARDRRSSAHSRSDRQLLHSAYSYASRAVDFVLQARPAAFGGCLTSDLQTQREPPRAPSPSSQMRRRIRPAHWLPVKEAPPPTLGPRFLHCLSWTRGLGLSDSKGRQHVEVRGAFL